MPNSIIIYTILTKQFQWSFIKYNVSSFVSDCAVIFKIVTIWFEIEIESGIKWKYKTHKKIITIESSAHFG